MDTTLQNNITTYVVNISEDELIEIKSITKQFQSIERCLQLAITAAEREKWRKKYELSSTGFQIVHELMGLKYGTDEYWKQANPQTPVINQLKGTAIFTVDSSFMEANFKR